MNPFEMLKNVDEIKKQAEKLQDQMKDLTASGTSGGDMVEAVVNGKMEIISLHIDPALLDKEKAQMLEVLVSSAVNTALKNVRQLMESKASQQMAGMNIPWGNQ